MITGMRTDETRYHPQRQQEHPVDLREIVIDPGVYSDTTF